MIYSAVRCRSQAVSGMINKFLPGEDVNHEVMFGPSMYIKYEYSGSSEGIGGTSEESSKHRSNTRYLPK